MKFKPWITILRPQFLILSLILVFYGSAIAYYHGHISISDSIIAFIGLVCMHIAVNLFNEYYDFVTELDLYTVKTPFSGGSGILPKRLIAPKIVYVIAVSFTSIGAIIGIYFLATKGIMLLPILILGAICVLVYTPYLTKIGLGELSAGLGLGLLPVIGTYFVITNHFAKDAIIAAIIPALLTSVLLLLNEFPDYEPDRYIGRKNLLIILGKHRAIKIYQAIIIFTYIFITISVAIKLSPPSTLISLATIPIAIKTIKYAKKYYNNSSDLLPALSGNVKLVLGTQILIAIGYILGHINIHNI